MIFNEFLMFLLNSYSIYDIIIIIYSFITSLLLFVSYLGYKDKIKQVKKVNVVENFLCIFLYYYYSCCT